MNQDSQASNTVNDVKKKPNTKSIWVDLVVCVLVPTLILKKLSGADSLGPTYALIAALSLPLIVGVWGFIQDRKIKFIPALGFISILLTGTIGILQLPKEYIAYKEALIPALIAMAAGASTFTSYPLIRTLIYSDAVTAIFDTDKVSERLKELDKQNEFDLVTIKATWVFASAFILSSVLNYLLAKWIVVSESGTDAFNSELGTMNLYSYPVIALPSTIISMFSLIYVFRSMLKLTGYNFEDIITDEFKEQPANT